MRTVAVVLLVLAAACSGSSKPVSAPVVTQPATSTSTTGSTTTTAAPVDYKAAYLKLIAPVNTSLDALDASKSDANGDVPAPVVALVVHAINDFETAALRSPWPNATTRNDVRDLVRGFAPLAGDLATINSQTSATEATWLANFTRDDNTANAAANIVRADLGLPPPTQ